MGFTSEARWLRYARAHLCHRFPYLPQQPGYNKRLRGAAPLIRHCIRALAASTASWTDDVWIVDSTPWSAAAPARLPNGPTWPTPKPTSAPVPLAIFTADPDLTTTRPGQALPGGKNYYGAAFETALADTGIKLLRAARHGEPRAAAHLFKPPRQIIESVNDTLKGQLDLERHGGHTPSGVITPVLQRILAPTAAIWHNDTTSPPQRLPRERAIPRANAGHPQTTSADAARSHCLRSSSAQ